MSILDRFREDYLAEQYSKALTRSRELITKAEKLAEEAYQLDAGIEKKKRYRQALGAIRAHERLVRRLYIKISKEK